MEHDLEMLYDEAEALYARLVRERDRTVIVARQKRIFRAGKRAAERAQRRYERLQEWRDRRREAITEASAEQMSGY